MNRRLLDAHEASAITSLLFGDFELRADSGQLLRKGVPVKLQLQPARVLALLALHAGAVVSREEIRNAVWGEESHVDFDLALNYSIRQIRLALDDSAAQPRFVETLPRIGYRFLAAVEVRPEAEALLSAAPEMEPSAAALPARTSKVGWQQILVVILALAPVGSLIALRSRVDRTRDLPAPASPAPKVPEDAMRAYLEGEYFAARSDPKARDAFRKATALAPRFAPAWAALGRELLDDQGPARELEPIVEAAERRALELDPKLASAHLIRAMRLFQFEYDWRESEREFRQALKLNPQVADTHREYAMLLASQGRHAEALDQIEQAQYLQPERQLVARYAWFYYLARRYDDAVTKARQQIELAPSQISETNPTQPALFWAFRTLVLASLAKGDPETALQTARAETRWLGVAEPASLADFWAAKERLFAKVGSVRPWYRVVPAIELGQPERALDMLFQQCQDRSDSMIAFLRVDPLYDSLRNRPRFAELLRCARLSD